MTGLTDIEILQRIGLCEKVATKPPIHWPLLERAGEKHVTIDRDECRFFCSHDAATLAAAWAELLAWRAFGESVRHHPFSAEDMDLLDAALFARGGAS